MAYSGDELGVSLLQHFLIADVPQYRHGTGGGGCFTGRRVGSHGGACTLVLVGRQLGCRDAVPMRLAAPFGNLDLVGAVAGRLAVGSRRQQVDQLLAMHHLAEQTGFGVLGIELKQLFGAAVGQHDLIIPVDGKNRFRQP